MYYSYLQKILDIRTFCDIFLFVVTMWCHMKKQDNIIRSRIDHETKLKAQSIFSQLGLSMSDAMRLFLHQVIEENGLPFLVKIPNRQTMQAIQEIESDQSTSTSLKEIGKNWRDAQKN